MIEQQLWLAFLAALAVALVLPWAVQRFLLGRPQPDGHQWRLSVIKWTTVLGGTGLALGLVLPLVLTPGADQGPLFGALIGLPLGGLLGAAIGSWLGVDRRRG